MKTDQQQHEFDYCHSTWHNDYSCPNCGGYMMHCDESHSSGKSGDQA